MEKLIRNSKPQKKKNATKQTHFLYSMTHLPNYSSYLWNQKQPHLKYNNIPPKYSNLLKIHTVRNLSNYHAIIIIPLLQILFRLTPHTNLLTNTDYTTPFYIITTLVYNIQKPPSKIKLTLCIHKTNPSPPSSIFIQTYNPHQLP
jgi:hypothetical protein